MSPSLLLSCEAVSKAYGTRLLFEGLSFGLFEGDHAGLVGPNGSGKSTLLRILAGIETADRGTRSLRGGVRVGYVPQDPVFPRDGTVDDVITAGLASVNEGDRPGRIALARGRAGLVDGRAEVATLSGGWRKRLAIARELAAAPDILLMDEPTNHLDVEGILWLERLLAEQARAVLVVSHDRYFLEHVATRVLELNRAYPDGLFATAGRYSEFLARRDDFLRGQAAYEDSLANTVRREIEWLRRGAKARSTKARGRIEQAERLQQELARRPGARRRRCRRDRARCLLAPDEEAPRRPRLDQVARRPTDRPRPRSHDHARHAGRSHRSERQRQDDLARPVRGHAGARCRRTSSAPSVCASCASRRTASLDPAQPLRLALAPDGDTVDLAGPPGPRRVMGQALSVPRPSSSRCPSGDSPAASRRASSSRG